MPRTSVFTLIRESPALDIHNSKLENSSFAVTSLVNVDIVWIVQFLEAKVKFMTAALSSYF